MQVGSNVYQISGNASNRDRWVAEGYLLRTTSNTYRIFIERNIWDGNVKTGDYVEVTDGTVTDFNPLNISIYGITNSASQNAILEIGYLEGRKAP